MSDQSDDSETNDDVSPEDESAAAEFSEGDEASDDSALDDEGVLANSVDADEKQAADLQKVSVELKIVLGTTTMPLHQMLRMARGAVVPLDAHADDDVQIYAGEVLIARGQLKLSGEHIQVITSETDSRAHSFREPSDKFTKPSEAA